MQTDLEGAEKVCRNFEPARPLPVEKSAADRGVFEPALASMAEKANVPSIEALELFRLNLIVYVSKARPALEEVSADLLRTRMWLQNDQRLQWEYQFRRREKELQQAEQAFSSGRLSSFRQDKST